jgi:hypothetical protein
MRLYEAGRRSPVLTYAAGLNHQIREGTVCCGVEMQLWLLDDQYGRFNPADAAGEMLHNEAECPKRPSRRFRRAIAGVVVGRQLSERSAFVRWLD